MCQFGDSSKILEELIIPENEALIGWRINKLINPFNNNEKFLSAINNDYIYPKNELANGTGLERGNSLGIYNYNYNHNNYYCLQVKTLHHGKVFKYAKGYRSEFCKVTHFLILDRDSKWFTDAKTIKFANHFNSLLENLAKEYNCDVIEYSLR